MGIGDIIRARRKELGLTLEQVGDIVGVTKNTVRQWENGNISNMRRDRIAKLAEALKIDPMNLIGEDGTDAVENNYLRIWGQPLIEAYRNAPDYIQKAICQMLQIEQLTIPILPIKEEKNNGSNRKKSRSAVAGKAKRLGGEGAEGRSAESISEFDARPEGKEGGGSQG